MSDSNGKRPSPAPRENGIVTGELPVVREPAMMRWDRAIFGVENLPVDGLELASFETNTLTPEMVKDVLAEQLNSGFFRTPAGYVSMTAGLTDTGDLTVTLLHWKSMNFPEHDEKVRSIIAVGPLARTTDTGIFESE